MDITTSCEPYDICSYNKLENVGFRLIHCNIRSLKKNFNKLLELISSVNFPFHIICLSETFIYANQQSYFPIPNYVFLGECRPTRCGGTGAYVHSSLVVLEQTSLNLMGAEAMSLRLTGVGERPIYVTTIYRTPSADIGGFLADLDNYLYSLSCLDNHIITGDINIDTLIPTSTSTSYSDIISQYNFHNLITIPTRIYESSRTCIDHILVNFNNSVIISGTLLKDTSDHFPVFANLDLQMTRTPDVSHRRCYKNINATKICKVFSDVDWGSLIYNFNDVNICYNNFVKKSLDIFDEIAPIKSQNYKPKRTHMAKFWFTGELKKQIAKKDRLFIEHKTYPFSIKLKRKYTKQRNLVSTLIKKEKSKYYSSVILQEKSPRKLWDIINQSCGRKSSKNHTVEKLLDNSNEIINDQQKIAHTLNEFFTKIGPKLASAIPDQASNLKSFKNINNDSYESFDLLKVDESIVLKELLNINENKATGLDLIPPKLVKICAKHLTSPLTYIINLSIESSTVPTNMKTAKVLPIYKNKGSKLSCNNYRPISILPIYSKIFEKVINWQLQNHLNLNNIISKSQYGFQKNKGTRDALIDFANQSLSALNNSNIILGIFIDFSKAFDTINHRILLNKLETYYFSSDTIKFFKSYLSNRTQQIALNNNVLSPPLEIECGVPQGSILGPTLFLIYINDLIKFSNIFTPLLFADDTNLFFTSKNLNNNISLINDSLANVQDWCNANKLTLNIEKTNFIIIKNPQNHFQLANKITLNNSPISQAESIKFLGIIIDTKLNWSKHIDSLRSQLHKSLGLIYLASSFLPTHILILLYNSLINSKIIYCLEAWGNAPTTYLNKIYLIQKRLVRIIYRKNPHEHSSPLFKRAKILPIFQLYTLRISLLAHSLYYTQHHHLASKYPTRFSKYALPFPKSTSSAGHRQVTYQMAAAWNQLPTSLKALESVVAFKVALKQHLLDLMT